MGETPLALPIFIAEDDDVMVFLDLATAELKLECVDVDDGVYEGWDAEGHVLELQTLPAHGATGARAVLITARSPVASDPQGLRDRLARILDAYAAQPTAGRSLAEVVTAFVDWAGYTR
jgi:hypothetical protein